MLVPFYTSDIIYKHSRETQSCNADTRPFHEFTLRLLERLRQVREVTAGKRDPTGLPSAGKTGVSSLRKPGATHVALRRRTDFSA